MDGGFALQDIDLLHREKRPERADDSGGENVPPGFVNVQDSLAIAEPEMERGDAATRKSRCFVI